MGQSTRVAIGLGSNLGDREGQLNRAIDELATIIDSVECSTVIETVPWGVEEQPSFLNAVAVGQCALGPRDLFIELKKIEQVLGRSPRERFGPREIDLDLLIYGNEVYQDDIISVPHYALSERDFVLGPLSELWPGWEHPKRGLTVIQMLDALVGEISPSDSNN